MSAQIIDRENGEKAKGFRLQKLRAAKLMLETLQQKPETMFYAAIEVVEDVYIKTFDSSGSESKFEEDKNYNSETNFTVFSPEVTNTLVSFFDIYTSSWRSSDKVILGFYTTAGIGKERKTTLNNGKLIQLPAEPILKILSGPAKCPSQTSAIVHQILIDEYGQQYAAQKSSGNLETLQNYSPDEFENFLSKISWEFGQADEKILKADVLSLIRHSRLYNFKVANKEEIIWSLISEMLDEKQSLGDFVDRFVHSSQIELIFKRAESEEPRVRTDPTWQMLQATEAEITDKRNLSEKILAVCPGYDDLRMKLAARKAAAAKVEQQNSDKSFLALKYRILDACEQYLYQIAIAETLTKQEFDNVIEDLTIAAMGTLDELKKDYTYTLSNKVTIMSIVLDLMDSCFISLDRVSLDE